MKKLFAITLSLSLLVLLTGHGWIMRYYMREAKAQMKATLRRQADHPDLTVFRFDSTELSRLAWEEEKEFVYQGVMYDVISRTPDGRHTVIRCIADHKETALAGQWKDWNRKHSGHSGSFSLVKLLYGWEPSRSFTAPMLPTLLVRKCYPDTPGESTVDWSADLLRPPGASQQPSSI